MLLRDERRGFDVERLRASPKAEPGVFQEFSRMRSKFFLAVLLAFPLAASAASFTGIWKRNCADLYGVKIEPVDDVQYAISFCGYDGCFEAGTWMPNSPIAGDPSFEIISAERIGIHRSDDASKFFFYNRCTPDPTWRTPAKGKSKQTAAG